ncbi:putative plant specific eukaryotic initiation factor 4B [Helianthus debilis subsp. tardiflorus]
MAKKKATMTLKDFHGGSIPSDLSLPSAPGETVRPLNHVGFDRQSSWTNPMGRQDHRLRPGSAGAVRTYDDKTPFLAHNVQIGRNFDEDERKPLDGGSAPRRTVSDENIRGGTVVPVRQEPKSDYPLAGNVPTRPATTPLSQFTGGSTGGSFAARFSEAANVSSGTSRSYVKSEVGSLGPSNSNVGVESKIRGPSPNAWGPRKVAVGISESVAASWSAPDAATKLAHASALEKVSSGRWLSNQHKQTDVEVIRHPEPEAKIQSKGNTHSTFSYSSADVSGGRSSSMNDRLPMARTSTHSDGVQVQPSHGGVTLGGPESTERPKLKLLPRSKPIDSMEPLVAYKQTTPQSGELVTRSDTYGNVNSSVHNFAGPDDPHQVSERPRVNLKPRLQSLEQIERITERERNAVFGGARPRELVLKERGVDDVAVTQDMIQSPNRMKKDFTRAENPPMNPTVTARQNGKSEPFDHHRTGKTIDRREAEKSDAQRRSNWRSDNRKSSRDLEQQQERPPSPETWRKPVDPEPSAGPRYGKAASAVELAQAFSKSVSDPKVVAIDRFSSQRGLPGQAQIPFSRLTSQPATRSHINGH